MKRLVMVVILLCWSGAAGADIIEWQGADGVHHYTNLKGEVPKEQEASTRVVVDELARRPAGTSDAAGEARPAPQSLEPRREAQVVYDRSQVSQAYLRGLQRGLEAGGMVAGGGGGGVQINGPLAIANATTPAPYYDQYYPGYYPLITTSFDRGRSRHLTLRLLLQDQFAIDRAAPFVFEERLVPPFGYPPLGVDLNPFLPRGLPHGFPQETRVIVR